MANTVNLDQIWVHTVSSDLSIESLQLKLPHLLINLQIERGYDTLSGEATLLELSCFPSEKDLH